MSYRHAFFKRFIRAGVLGGLAIWLVLAAGVNIVAAHSELVESNPANGDILDEPPEQVRLKFTEELGAGSSVGVFDPKGQQLDDGNGGLDLNDLDHKTMVVILPESLANGKYIVRWKAVSAEDDDATNGTFAFNIGAATVADEQPIGETNSALSPLLLLAALIAVALVFAAAIYVGRKRAVSEKEQVAVG